ncbi:hypothetical protein F5Y11DRAFT_346641 [Daldinia sp. FL1419]|nr:hypothetical protein F5Y11DRAFT_346641 [Daldinia sp. FL1419]
MARTRCRSAIQDRDLRFGRLFVLLLTVFLSSRLYYPEVDYGLASAGIEIFWSLTQIIDLHCGRLPEISLVVQACIEVLATSLSLAMMLQLSLFITRRSPGLQMYWWAMSSWGCLTIMDIVLSYHTIKSCPRRQKDRMPNLRIMFKSSGDPVAVALSPSR